MRLREGDRATVWPDANVPYVLNFQRHVDIVRVTDAGYYVSTGSTMTTPVPTPGRPHYLGPIPEANLIPGWVLWTGTGAA